ncbi:MAG: PadR family transcriptional regulator [Luteitalea sp.]|nr:PadR family transcriptional regulator [Luteitalea sp.]
MAHKQDPEAFLPLTPALFHVLVALAAGDKHGYAILRDVEQRTEGRVLLSTGTLYGIIKRLLADDLIAEARTRPAASMDDQRRRYYRLTAFGRDVALAETARLEQASAMARATRGLRLARGKA